MGKFDLSAQFSAAPAGIGGQPGPRSIEAITEEILQNKRSAGEAILRIGQCLIEAKQMLTHGEWLPWLQERVEFSERTATRFMRLAREWTNQTALSDLGATKALALLVLPQEEREQFLSERHMVDGGEKAVIDMTSRELAQALREKEVALAEKRAAEQAREAMAQDVRMTKSLLEAANQEKTAALDRSTALRRELDELKARPVEITGAAVPDESALAAARAEGEAAALEKRRRLAGCPEAALFRVYYEAVQENFSRMLGCLQKVSRTEYADEYDQMSDAVTDLFSVTRDMFREALG